MIPSFLPASVGRSPGRQGAAMAHMETGILAVAALATAHWRGLYRRPPLSYQAVPC